ncbi:hypothetical protein [Bacillus sp. 1735sda2]|uniref:hypothetical protein n=1 Tax=Bacillus sp. 1735sda2 TaxID=2953806 RepID=UPI00209E9A1A|nr:hypothetical protein [Bacillus sp. 1735sda2]MCP1147376.1 hypothetical protein [Bacillus sp. 1735sda2]
MSEYKEFQITLPSGEIIRRNSEGLYGSNNIVVDKDYVIDTLVQSHQEQGKEEMKFYETREPYYALIKARNIERAMEIYNNDVTADEEKELAESIKEVTALYAATKYSRCTGEDNKTVPIEEVLEDLTNEKEMRLAVDGSLL